MNTLGITRGPYLVNVALLSEALILDVIPFWYDIQNRPGSESNTILVLLPETP